MVSRLEDSSIHCTRTFTGTYTLSNRLTSYTKKLQQNFEVHCYVHTMFLDYYELRGVEKEVYGTNSLALG
jgi:hypothetical protein